MVVPSEVGHSATAEEEGDGELEEELDVTLEIEEVPDTVDVIDEFTAGMVVAELLIAPLVVVTLADDV